MSFTTTGTDYPNELVVRFYFKSDFKAFFTMETGTILSVLGIAKIL